MLPTQCVWFVVILTINIHYSPLVFVMVTLCDFCKVGAEFLNMVHISSAQICHKARKHHKILGARKLMINKYHTGVPQTPVAS